MARNIGGGRKGAVSNRFQLKNVKTGLFTIFSSDTGKPVWTKKSPGAAKGVSKQLPKKFR